MKNNPLHILLVDNYDSFSYNLAEMLRSFSDVKLTILKNDDLSIFMDHFDAMIISPGPGLPEESAFLLEAIDYYSGRIPMLGICLGLQAIVCHFGGKLKQLPTVFHGIKDNVTIFGESQKEIEQNSSSIFNELPARFQVGRYHSWVADKKSLPSNLQVLAEDSYGNIMAIEDNLRYCFAVQFHPESYMTPLGGTIMKNFIDLTYKFHKAKKAYSRQSFDYNF